MKTGRKPGPVPTADCKQCGVTFNFKRYGAGQKWHYNRTQEFCSRECAAEFQVKGDGWGLDKNGYKVSNRSDGKRRNYVFQHRVVMERYLGRKLFSHEMVHHKDGNRANNAISNLELWSSRHGKGQRVDEKLEFCVSFIKEYPELLKEMGYELTHTDETRRPADLPCSNWTLSIQ